MTQKQKDWISRNQLLFRIRGLRFYLPTNRTIVTPHERFILQQIEQLRDELIKQSVESSRQLGFNARYRDQSGKPIPDDEAIIELY